MPTTHDNADIRTVVARAQLRGLDDSEPKESVAVIDGSRGRTQGPAKDSFVSSAGGLASVDLFGVEASPALKHEAQRTASA
jgi:hypothetical protein